MRYGTSPACRSSDSCARHQYIAQRRSCTKDPLFPHEIPSQTDDGYQKNNEIEDPICPKARDDSFVLPRKPDCRSHDGVKWKEGHCEDE